MPDITGKLVRFHREDRFDQVNLYETISKKGFGNSEQGYVWDNKIRERLFVFFFRHLSLDPASWKHA